MAGQNRKKKSRHGIAIAAIIAAAALAFCLILWQFVFVIRDVQVVGNGSVPAEEVIRLSRIQMGAKLNSIDKALMENHIESDGRIALESIETRYPNHVVLNVRQRTKDAMTVQANKVIIMDSDGYVVEVLDHLPSESPSYVTGLHIAGYSIGKQIDAEDDRILAMKSVVEAIREQNVAGYVSEINVEDARNIRITTRTGMAVKLGNGDNMHNKILWMVGAVQDLEARGQAYGTLDVSSGTKADYSAEQ